MKLLRLRLALMMLRWSDRMFPDEPETGPYWPALQTPSVTDVSRRLADTHSRDGHGAVR